MNWQVVWTDRDGSKRVEHCVTRDDARRCAAMIRAWAQTDMMYCRPRSESVRNVRIVKVGA